MIALIFQLGRWCPTRPGIYTKDIDIDNDNNNIDYNDDNHNNINNNYIN